MYEAHAASERGSGRGENEDAFSVVEREGGFLGGAVLDGIGGEPCGSDFAIAAADEIGRAIESGKCAMAAMEAADARLSTMRRKRGGGGAVGGAVSVEDGDRIAISLVGDVTGVLMGSGGATVLNPCDVFEKAVRDFLGSGDANPSGAILRPLAPAETLIVVSDGVWRNVEKADYALVCAGARRASEIAEDILRLAASSGATDDCTVLVVKSRTGPGETTRGLV